MGLPIDLWSFPLDKPDAGSLSADEQARANRFVFARDRDRYVAGRARLRAILSQYLDQPAADIRFGYGSHGRPGVDGIAFNLSHTGDQALLAVAQDVVLGVDIEAIAPIEMAVAKAHFAPEELRALLALPEPGQVPAFYRCWTRKEAYLKAMGTGLATDLSSFTVTLGPNEDPKLLTCAPGDAAAWQLFDVAPAPGIAGALAVRAGAQQVTLNWRSDVPAAHRFSNRA
ncbi:4'-phosphopantetheinyl transferase superfamily protein [Yoonia sp. BS5-3]|uniref:4'-phosphopantetheinyl transferase superfamily protein n=1 Tax=Yoonia phaeophyticola TaxID=3137369 RepID=A0ABZ2V563_9RHOB